MWKYCCVVLYGDDNKHDANANDVTPFGDQTMSKILADVSNDYLGDISAGGPEPRAYDYAGLKIDNGCSWHRNIQINAVDGAASPVRIYYGYSGSASGNSSRDTLCKAIYLGLHFWCNNHEDNKLRSLLSALGELSDFYHPPPFEGV